jgi:leader peptidase (prepilin peptidase)/N-methyltransferase
MIVLAAALVGAVAGTLLATPAYRLSVPAGHRPDCAACDQPLAWFGVDRPGRCPRCRARTGPRPWLLATLSGAVCAGLAWAVGPRPELLPLMLVGVLGVLLGAVDVAVERLPDVLVLPGVAVAVVAFGVIAALTSSWGSWGRAVAAGLAYMVGYFVLALLPGGQLGLGDVKLAALLGLCLGWFGWPLLVAGVLLPWLVNAPVALVLLVRRGGGSMPFGPAMLVGAGLSLVVVLPFIYGKF